MLMLNLAENSQVWFWFPTHLNLSRMTPTRGCSMIHFNDRILLLSVGGATVMGGGVSNTFRSSHPEVLRKKSVLKIFWKSTGKHLEWGSYLIKLFKKDDFSEKKLPS